MANGIRARTEVNRIFRFNFASLLPPDDLCSELNVERYELRKDATLTLNHSNGTHDDVFWSLALGVYATVDMKEIDLDAMRFG